MANNSSKYGVHISGEYRVGAAAGPRVLPQRIEAVAAETGAFVAVVFGFDELPFFVETMAHTQRVGQAHEADELFELVVVL